MGARSDVHVIGGGLGGLVAAALVADAGHGVTVHDARARLGGRATTDERDGFCFNQGPHALYVGGHAERVLGRLGIVPTGAPPSGRRAALVRGGRAHRAPLGPVGLARTSLLGLGDKAALGRILIRLPGTATEPLAGSTVTEWVASLTTRQRVAEVLHALVRLATYADAPDTLSAEVAASQLQLIVAGGVRYLDGGWERLVRQLAERRGITLDTGARHDELPDAPVVIVAVGGPDTTARLTGHRYPPGVPAEVSVLDLGLSKPPARSFLLGVDEPRYLSEHSVAEGLAPPGRATVSVAAYLGAGDPVAPDALEAFAGHAGIDAGDVVVQRRLHRLTAVTAIATAAQGGSAGRADVTVPGHQGVFAVGDWVGRRGHLADAVLASAEEAAERTVEHLERRAVRR